MPSSVMMDIRRHITQTRYGTGMVKSLTSAPTAQWHARWWNSRGGKRLKRSRDALDMRSLGILFSFWHSFPEQMKKSTFPKSSTRSSGPGEWAESADENTDFWGGKYTLQRNRDGSQRRRGERGRWVRLTLDIVVMDPYRRQTVPDSYGARTIDRVDGSVIRRVVRCLKFEEETARSGAGKAKG